MLQLRGTQPKFTKIGIDFLNSKSTKKTLLVAPVAYGKSICIAYIVSKLKGSTVVLQPNKELLEQNFKKFIVSGQTASICSNSMKSFQKQGNPYTRVNGKNFLCNEISNVTYATIGTIKSMLPELRAQKIKYLIIDEAHLNTKNSSSIKKFITALNIKNVLGVTATPISLKSSFDGSMLKMINSEKDNLFNNIAHVVQVQEMVENNFWSKLAYDVYSWNNSGLKFNSIGSDYTKESLKINYTDNFIEDKCIKAVRDLKKEGRKSILVFVPSIADAENLSKKIKDSKVLHGNVSTDNRNKIIDDFKNLKLEVLINVEILTTGFDHPELDAIVLARPTASIALYYQILGRITRIHDKKLNGKIVDLSGNVFKFGKVENLNYDYIEGYGWGLFSKDSLLTDYPLNASDRPSKQTLTKYSKAIGFNELKRHSKVKIWFGKYKDSTLDVIDPNYLIYLLTNMKFNTPKKRALRDSMEIVLKLK